MWLLAISISIIAYLLGSLPAGYLAGKIKGIDVREHGSGNIGATNVLRVLGKPWGLFVFFADAFKGFAAVRVALALVRQNDVAASYTEFMAILAAIACVIGHSFPIWLRFQGGKGVATSAGAILGIMPLAALAILLVWASVFALTRYVSVASMVAAVALPVAVTLLIKLKMTEGFVLLYFSIAMAALVVWRHRSNIVRLMNGTEPRFTGK